MSADNEDVKSEIRALRNRMHDVSNVAQNLVTRDATMALQVTNLVSLFTEHKNDSKAFMDDTRAKLAAISKQTTETNGRVNGHDDHFGVNDREIRDIKETLAKVMWLIFGLFATVIGGVAVYWMTNR